MTAPPPPSAPRREAIPEKQPVKRVEPAAIPLGAVSEIKGSSVFVEVQPSQAASLQLGEILTMTGHSLTILGEIASIQRHEQTSAEVRLIASIDPRNGALSPGVHEVPGVGSHVHRTPKEIIRAVYEDRRSISTSTDNLLQFSLANSKRYEDLELSFTPERLIGRHLAIVGSSGGGKSCSVARLVEQCAAHKSKVVLLDLTGEYEPLSGSIFHVHLGNASRDGVISSATSLPFYELTEADLVSILEPDSPLQLAKLRAAIKTLKLLHLDPKLAADGNFPKAHKEKLVYERAVDDFKHELNAPENLFDIYRLPLQIELECVDVHRSQTENNFWGGVNTLELSGCSGLIHRTQELLRDGQMSSLFLSHEAPSLISILDTFLADPKFSVLRISLEFIPSSNNIREILANAVGRRLLDLGRKRALMTRPTLLIVDEAHQVLRPTASIFARDFPLDSFNIIAKEGRKYGLALCVATQRPGDIPEDVLSQMGTFVIHRLVGSSDRAHVERATGACDRAMLEDLPALSAGEAFLLGIEFSRPLRVRIKLPENRPRSHGPDYQSLWRR